MSDIAIRVENLGKQYHIGALLKNDGLYSYKSLRDSIADVASMPFRAARSLLGGKRTPRPPQDDIIWALKDVSFDVRHGEIVGVIGRNGAGKSTLLKLLSRITEPTTGRVEIHGRVGSLLEVGTGFHPELTGRDNVFLNGAILGMKRAEIAKNFDAIVAFAEVEKFIDTPVKHYSSGMYLRLAFAVAAHLQTEILIVDEVLAVGDLQFQKKCLGKMQEASTNEGRTVIIVSHNLDSILRLCSVGIWLDGGHTIQTGNAVELVNSYCNYRRDEDHFIELANRRRAEYLRNHATFLQIECKGDASHTPWIYSFGSTLSFKCTISVSLALSDLSFAFALFTNTGFEVASTRTRILKHGKSIEPGLYQVSVDIPFMRLSPSTYRLNLGIDSEFGPEDFIAEAAVLEVTSNETSASCFADGIMAACIPEMQCTLTRN